MAKHLAEGRAFPLYFYGQAYMLAVQAWLAAPLFLLAGASIALLKLPLVLINGAAAGLLVWALIRYAQLTALAAFCASVFFVVAPPVTGSSLVAAMGGSVEPFLYILLIWLTRNRPIVCGLIAGVGFLHREFSGYGLAALMITSALYQRQQWRTFAGGAVVTAVTFLMVLEAGRLLLPFSDPFGPDLPAFSFTAGLSNVDALTERVQCSNGLELWPNMQWLMRDNLPVLFGAAGKGADQYFLGPALASSWTIGILLVMALVAAVGRVIATVVVTKRRALPQFVLFLLLVGVQAAAAYVASCKVRDPMLVRYTFLVLLIPIAIAAAHFRIETWRPLRVAATLLLLGWAGWSAQNYWQMVSSYIEQPPISPRAVVARELEQRGLRRGYAAYWDAYPITFLSDERVILASGAPARILSYDSIVARALNRVYVQPNPCPGDQIAGLWLCVEEASAAVAPPSSPTLDLTLPSPQDVALLMAQLEAKYRDLGRPAATSAVDREGVVAWTLEYLRYRINGCDPSVAVTRVYRQIDGATGSAGCAPVREVLMPARPELRDFARELETKYRQGLKRAPTQAVVDLESGAEWIAHYVNYRARGCGHDRALGRVLRLVDGRVALPDC